MNDIAPILIVAVATSLFVALVQERINNLRGDLENARLELSAAVGANKANDEVFKRAIAACEEQNAAIAGDLIKEREARNNAINLIGKMEKAAAKRKPISEGNHTCAVRAIDNSDPLLARLNGGK
ncbi:MAG: hypothetical protein LBU73_07990 [Helicobacteraceae bacterium]|jgi:predicted Holliday junction resolvase-like endonuclease|nr:hypothetical protein [Helicobacteraceae bacterium]